MHMNPRSDISTVPADQLNDLPDVCSTREVAQLLGVSLRTIQLWVDSGILEAWKTAGGHRRITRESVIRLLRQSPDICVPINGERDGWQEHFHLAYQPILDAQSKPLGYELLYRNGNEADSTQFVDPVKAASQVLRTAFGELGFLSATGDGLCFVKVEYEMLDEDLLQIFEPSRVVLELPSDKIISDELLERCISMRRLGFRFLLENFRIGRNPERLLQLADFIKVDFRTSIDALLVTSKLETMSGRIKLIGDRVESLEAFELAKRVGCDYFQGFYFSRPVMVKGRQISPQKMVLLDLLRLLLSSTIDNIEIEKRLKLEPSLCFNLLKLVNSAASGLSRQITTLREILLVMGRQNLVRWIQILLYSSDTQLIGSPNPLLQSAAFRGRFLENMISLLPAQANLRDHAFMVGILSYADTLLGVPLNQVLARLNLPQHIHDALLSHGGVLGELLSLSIALDQANFGEADVISHKLEIDRACMRRRLIESLTWCNALLKSA